MYKRQGSTPEQLTMESRGPCTQHALVTLSSIRKARLEVCEGNLTWLHTGTDNHGVTRSMHATRTRSSESEVWIFRGEHGTLLHTGTASHGVTQYTLHTLVHQTSLLVRDGFRVVVTPDDDPP